MSGCEKRYFLGIDTSNYTTSAAAVDEDGRIIAFSKRLLPVRAAGRAQTERSGIFACKAASRSYGRACFTD